MGNEYKMNAEEADYQLKRIQECVDVVEACKQTIDKLDEGQTSTLWTADGKSIDLIDAIKARYTSSKLWLTELTRQLEEAHFNLQKAVDETDQMDAEQKERFQKALGAIGPIMRIMI